MSNFDETNPSESEDELWHVRLATGEVHMVTLEQLDDAFQNGWIDESTLVSQDGSDWSPLGEAAGLGSEEEAPAPAPQPVATRNQGYGYPGETTPTIFTSSPPTFQSPMSTAPVAFEIDDDLDAPFRPRKRKWVYAFAAVAIVGAGGFGFTKMDSAPQIPPPVAAASPVVPTQETFPPVAPPPETKPSDSMGSNSLSKSADSAKDSQLSDDKKRALLEADKGRASKRKAPSAPQAAGGGSPKPRSTAPVFHKGGSPHDPLNASL
jgi:hypothetical protein